MLRNPHVTTGTASVMDRFLNVQNRASIDQPFGRLTAFEAGSATSIEKAFVNRQFNDLSTSAHAGDSRFSLAAFSLSAAFSTLLKLSHARSQGTVYETSEVAS